MAAISIPSALVHLSKTKRAHPRDGDETDTIVIRDESESAIPRYRTFGVKGRANLENVYFGLMAVLDANPETIVKISEYKQERMKDLLQAINNVDQQKMKAIAVKPDEERTRLDRVELRSVLTDSYPRLGLFLYDQHDRIVTGIYLFVQEVVNLLQWMNQYYGIGDTQFVTYEITEKFDFF